MLRDKAGLTQKQVAMAMGVEPHVYNQIENGKGGALMNAKKLLALADLLMPHDLRCFLQLEVQYQSKIDELNGINAQE